MREDFKAVEYKEGALVLIDQRKLPHSLEYVSVQSSEEVASAISTMIVRGAPAIGGAAAYGVCFAAAEAGGDIKLFMEKVEALKASRPTAVNLAWAAERVSKVYLETLSEEAALKEADEIVREDIEMNRAMGKAGSALIKDGSAVLTHCNAGALATCGWGTALGVIKSAVEEGKHIRVYADETRPRLQGARLTCWELVRAGIDTTLIPDSAAATLIREGRIGCIIVGADRIAANGDTANKLGTFPLSIVAREYKVPFYIAAPYSTIDLSCPDGRHIPIEERSDEEVTMIEGVRIAAEGVKVFNPSFDVTPHENISAIITEKGVIHPPFSEGIAKIFTL